MLRSARKEIEIYDRNREQLFDLRHADLRSRVQTLVIRLTMPLEGVFESTVEINAYQLQSRAASGDVRLSATQVEFGPDGRATAIEWVSARN